MVEVEEGRTRRVAVGAGYDSESGARALLTLGDTNFLGRAGNLQLDLLASAKDERYRLVYTEPRLAGWPVAATATTYWEARDRDAYAVERWGTQVGLAHEHGPWRLRLLYDYHIVELSRIDEIFDVPVGSREGRVSSITPLLGSERRDDLLDPRRGWSALAQCSTPSRSCRPTRSSSSSSARRRGASTSPARHRGAEPARRHDRTARGRSFAAGNPFAGPVPVDERFYAGGRTRTGPSARTVPASRGTIVAGTPVGGSGLLLANLDLRFPIAGDLGGTVFLDGGNVWRERARSIRGTCGGERGSACVPVAGRTAGLRSAGSSTASRGEPPTSGSSRSQPLLTPSPKVPAALPEYLSRGALSRCFSRGARRFVRRWYSRGARRLRGEDLVKVPAVFPRCQPIFTTAVTPRLARCGGDK